MADKEKSREILHGKNYKPVRLISNENGLPVLESY
jgi:hypothetical protein